MDGELTYALVSSVHVHVHKSKIYDFLFFLIFRSQVITGRNLYNFINAEIVVRKDLYIHCLLIKLIEKSWAQYLSYSMLRSCPCILDILELRNDFEHLLSVHCYILIQELFDTVWAKVQEYRYLFKSVRICRLIYMEHIWKDIRNSGIYVRVQFPIHLRKEIPKDN